MIGPVHHRDARSRVAKILAEGQAAKTRPEDDHVKLLIPIHALNVGKRRKSAIARKHQRYRQPVDGISDRRCRPQPSTRSKMTRLARQKVSMPEPGENFQSFSGRVLASGRLSITQSLPTANRVNQVSGSDRLGITEPKIKRSSAMP